MFYTLQFSLVVIMCVISLFSSAFIYEITGLIKRSNSTIHHQKINFHFKSIFFCEPNYDDFTSPTLLASTLICPKIFHFSSPFFSTIIFLFLSKTLHLNLFVILSVLTLYNLQYIRYYPLSVLSRALYCQFISFIIGHFQLFAWPFEKIPGTFELPVPTTLLCGLSTVSSESLLMLLLL